MKTFRILQAATLLAALLTPSLGAQSVPPETMNPAKEVSLAKIPPFCKWTMVTTLYSLTNAPQAKVITVTLTGGIVSEKVDENGKHTQSFRVGLIEYKTTGGSEEGGFVPPGSLPIEDGSFPEFSWVRKRFFLGTTSVQNQKCEIYADIRGKPIPKTGDPSQKIAELLKEETVPGNAKVKRLQGILPNAFLSGEVRIACLNADTHFPVLLQNGFEVRSYAFELLPARDQSLPKKVKDLLEAVVKTNKALFAPYARP